MVSRMKAAIYEGQDKIVVKEIEKPLLELESMIIKD